MKYKYRHTEMYKDVRIDCKANSKRELIEKVTAKKNQIDHQVIDPSMKLSVFCEKYLQTYKEGKVSASWYADIQWFARKMVTAIGDRPIGKVHPVDVQEYINSCSCYADSTVKKIYDIANQIFRHAMKNGATDFAFDLVLPKGTVKRSSGRSLTDAEQTALLNAVDGHRGELFILFIYYCGLRPSEVSALTWADIDLRKNIVHVTKALKKDGIIGGTKSLAGVRDVPIPYKLSIALKKTARSQNRAVCEQSNGLHTKSSIRKMWASIKKQMEAELGHPTDCRLYDIRHTYCTNLEKAGVPINVASRLMGHSDISITSKIYTHASDDVMEQARRLIDNA